MDSLLALTMRLILCQFAGTKTLKSIMVRFYEHKRVHDGNRTSHSQELNFLITRSKQIKSHPLANCKSGSTKLMNCGNSSTAFLKTKRAGSTNVGSKCFYHSCRNPERSTQNIIHGGIQHLCFYYRKAGNCSVATMRRLDT